MEFSANAAAAAAAAAEGYHRHDYLLEEDDEEDDNSPHTQPSNHRRRSTSLGSFSVSGGGVVGGGGGGGSGNSFINNNNIITNAMPERDENHHRYESSGVQSWNQDSASILDFASRDNFNRSHNNHHNSNGSSQLATQRQMASSMMNNNIGELHEQPHHQQYPTSLLGRSPNFSPDEFMPSMLPVVSTDHGSRSNDNNGDTLVSTLVANTLEANRLESNLQAIESMGYQQQQQHPHQPQTQVDSIDNDDVIELLDDDDEGAETEGDDNAHTTAAGHSNANDNMTGVKRRHPHTAHVNPNHYRKSRPIQVGSTFSGYAPGVGNIPNNGMSHHHHHGIGTGGGGGVHPPSPTTLHRPLMRHIPPPTQVQPHLQTFHPQLQQQYQQINPNHPSAYSFQNHNAASAAPAPPPHGQAAAVAQMYHQQQLERREQRRQRSRMHPVAPPPPRISDPVYVKNYPTEGHTPTWKHPLPPLPKYNVTNHESKSFEFSLLNVSEFTITGLPVTGGSMWSSSNGHHQRSSVLGFRKTIKEISRAHGKAVFERYKDGSSNEVENHYESGPDGGKWRIPLGAYRTMYNYFVRLPYCSVIGIPEEQLKVASLGKARLEKGYPSVQKIVAMGVPIGLAEKLAPFQRGGVEFVKEKNGRALIADDMGLGKTIQGIAAMSIYHEEWPLLVLTPSSARYHWESEFQQWLGVDSINPVQTASSKEVAMLEKDDIEENSTKEKDEVIPPDAYRDPMPLLKNWEIHVLTSGKEPVIPYKDIKVVICSYGLAPSLVETGKICRGMFRCAIVDESHMLKNMNTKRTKNLVPILHATSRCVLLSGTPALARPAELWPQLKILSTEKDAIWEDENEFIAKYVQTTSAVRRAELHAMLTGTVMIRRMKHDILKSMPSKHREKALVDVATSSMRREFHLCMRKLREGKGIMANLAQKRSALKPAPEGSGPEDSTNDEAIRSLNEEYRDRLQQRTQQILSAVQSSSFSEIEKENVARQHCAEAGQELKVWYDERLHEIRDGSHGLLEDEEVDRKTVLNRMYLLTAKAKIPLLADLVKKWLNDPTKGKLCIFAHHIFVLDELEEQVELQNSGDSNKKFIRIDGSTNPRERQVRIKAFQSDPSIRIAILGITAAGVAVTLTASSTVWFAELFWTPALMIQAEDRCHRIGQNAQVKCLYFVAEGTLDVLLWDLLEKKFRDLGEFVEGKEKMKIVVHNTYDSIKELQSIFSDFGESSLQEALDASEREESKDDEEGLIKLEDDLQKDITQLAQEEMVMISQGEGEDDDGADVIENFADLTQKQVAKPGPGKSEEDAICLIDDDDESTEVMNFEKREKDPLDAPGVMFDFSKPFRKCRMYNQTFEGTSFGIALMNHQDRVVVRHNSAGKSKPAAGDILVAVNGQHLRAGVVFSQVLHFLKQSIARGPVEITFVEVGDFVKYFTEIALPAVESQIGCMKAVPAVSKPSIDDGDVIELLDDDC